MAQADWRRRIDVALAGVDLSSTSTRKYDDLREVLAELLEVPIDNVYAATVGKDYKVRSEQSADARRGSTFVAVLTGREWLEKSVKQARDDIAKGRGRVVFVLRGEDDQEWRVPLVFSNAAPHSGLSAAFPEVNQLTTPGPTAGTGSTNERGNEGFTEHAFELLGLLEASPTMETYTPIKLPLGIEVVEPFHAVFRRVVAQLPVSVAEEMETESRLFSRFVKNDYGRGGVWPHYWGAIYAGADRINGVQLFQWMNHDRLVFGFSVGEYASQAATLFNRNRAAHVDELTRLLEPTLSDESLWFGADSWELSASGQRWDGWFREPSSTLTCGMVLHSDAVVTMSQEDLAAVGLKAWRTLFPLVLLATKEEPVGPIARYLEASAVGPLINPPYGVADLANDTGLSEPLLERWVRAIDRHGQAILFGPPGTGKTFVAQRLARYLVADSDGLTEIVQFHPSYSYEDFMQGIRPKRVPPTEGGGLDYPIVPGRFKEFCREAGSRSGTCVLVIDEINRANLSRVFGELMYLLEYRDTSAQGGQHVTVPLATGEEFGIPGNVRLIGTMNTADRSIALVDHALRRRFAFLELFPDYEVLAKFHANDGFPIENLVSVLRALNDRIGDRHYAVGISYFLRKELAQDLEDIWSMQIEPYLEEFFFDDPARVDAFRWDQVRARVFGP